MENAVLQDYPVARDYGRHSSRETGFASTFDGFGHGRSAETEWRHQEANAGSSQLTVQLSETVPDSASFVVGIGIEMGMPDKYGEMQRVKYAGSGKILEIF